MECDKMSLILEGEFQVPSLVENNELAIEEECRAPVPDVEVEPDPWTWVSFTIYKFLIL